MKKLTLVLSSGEHEKLHMAGMLASVASVSAVPVDVFITMNALLRFKKGIPAEERYVGKELSSTIRGASGPDFVELFRQGRDLGEMKIYACSAGLDIANLNEDDLEEMFDGVIGISKFLELAEGSEI